MARPVLTPDPGVGLARVYDGLPEHVQTADERQGWPLYRWLGGICRVLSDLEEVRERIDYVPPGDRDEPWSPGPAALNLVTTPRTPPLVPASDDYVVELATLLSHPLEFPEGRRLRLADDWTPPPMFPTAESTGTTGTLTSTVINPYDSDTVYENLSIDNVDQYFQIVGDNLTFINCRFTNPTGVGFVTAHGLKLINCEFPHGFGISSCATTLVEYCKLENFGPGDGIHISSDSGSMVSDCTIRYNYIYNADPNVAAHSDGIQVRGSVRLKVYGNTIDMGPYDEAHNSAFYLQNANGGNHDWVVERNYLKTGHGFTLYVHDPGGPGIFRNNTVGVGDYGYAYDNLPAIVTVFGNVKAEDGTPLNIGGTPGSDGGSGESAAPLAVFTNIDGLGNAAFARWVGAWVMCDVDAVVRLLDDGGFPYEPTVTLPAGTWQWVEATSAVDGTVGLEVRLLGREPTLDDRAYVSGVLASVVNVQGYFDGGTPSTNYFTYGWNELPNASTSFRTPRPDDTSDLADPATGDLAWLPWMAQLVGVTLAPELVGERARDAVLYSSSGWRAGTRGAVADAARSELTGTKYVAVYDHSITTVGDGGVWDVLVVTRPTETPDPVAVLEAIIERGAKPAGVVLHHRAYESEWDTVTSENPTWADYTESWDEIQEAGF